MYMLVHVSPYCYIRFRAAGKGSKAFERSLRNQERVKITLFLPSIIGNNKIEAKCWIYCQDYGRGILSK